MKFDDKYKNIARPYTACFVLLRRENKIAMVLRKNTGWMDGHYGLPAGKGEWHESFSEIAIREAQEEAGVRIKPNALEFVHVAHRRASDGNLFMDWVDVYFVAKMWEGEPHNAEPDKSAGLAWIDLNDLPENVVPSQRVALEALALGASYSEFGWEA